MPMLTQDEAHDIREAMRATVAQWTPNLTARPMLAPLPDAELALARLLVPAWRYKGRLLILAEVEQHGDARRAGHRFIILGKGRGAESPAPLEAVTASRCSRTR